MSEITIPLSSKSFMTLIENCVICSDNDFNDLMIQKPEIRGVVKMFGKPVEIARFQKLYGVKGAKVSYTFTGTRLEAEENIPKLVQDCLDFVKEKYSDFKWNGALVNWYPTGEDYISQHSDDEKDLCKNAPICSFSFGSERTFLIQKKDGIKVFIDELKIPTKHQSMISMCGSMQKEFKHGIPKTKKSEPVPGSRINITIRAFN